jgi:uncharacterized protein YndB with AHSA1/START domain
MIETSSNENELIITRYFDAPRELVWKAWTEPEFFKIWWGPKYFTSPFADIDLRIGGKYLNCMRSPEERDYWNSGVYKEIIPLEKLSCTDSFSDECGNILPAAYYGMNSDFPLEMLVTIIFEDFEGKTKMTLIHSFLPIGKTRELTAIGWDESFDKLEKELSRMQVKEIITEENDKT